MTALIVTLYVLSGALGTALFARYLRRLDGAILLLGMLMGPGLLFVVLILTLTDVVLWRGKR